MLSNSVSTPSRSWTMSYPPSDTWQVSRQTPTLPESSTPVQNGPQLLKTAAYFAALACHGLQQNGGGLIGPQDGVESVGNESDAGLASLPHMAAGMEVVILSWHMLQPSQVVRHGLPGEYPVLLLLNLCN